MPCKGRQREQGVRREIKKIIETWRITIRAKGAFRKDEKRGKKKNTTTTERRRSEGEVHNGGEDRSVCPREEKTVDAWNSGSYGKDSVEKKQNCLRPHLHRQAADRGL